MYVCEMECGIRVSRVAVLGLDDDSKGPCTDIRAECAALSLAGQGSRLAGSLRKETLIRFRTNPRTKEIKPMMECEVKQSN